MLSPHCQGTLLRTRLGVIICVCRPVGSQAARTIAVYNKDPIVDSYCRRLYQQSMDNALFTLSGCISMR